MSIYFKGTKYTASGVSDYSQLTSKPSINGKVLVGNVTVGGVVEVSSLPTTGISTTTLYKKGDALYWHDGTDWVQLNKKSAGSGDVPTGTVVPFIGLVAPDGWLLCQGQAISRTAYSDLYQMVGTTYGAGDGSTTFNIPDLRGRFVEGASTTVGHTLHSKVAAALPTPALTFSGSEVSTGSGGSHSHTFGVGGGGSSSPGDKGVGVRDGYTTVSPAWNPSTSSAGSHSHKVTAAGTVSLATSNTIYGKSTTVQPASICMHWIIRC